MSCQPRQLIRRRDVFKILSICKGGGYRYCRTEPPHPNRNEKGLYPLHRVLMENRLGRLLTSGEHVHHKDEDKTNDDPNNLELMTASEHAAHHRHVDAIECRCPCGKAFSIKPAAMRLRLKRSRSGRLYCGRDCVTLYGPGSLKVLTS